MKKHIRISVFEIALIGILLSIALTAKYFDKFIPHVHPFHIVSLLIGIALLRVASSFMLIGSYILSSSLLFGIDGPTMLAFVLHAGNKFILLLFCFVRYFRNKNSLQLTFIMIILIIITLALYLFIMIIADSEYTRVLTSETPF